MDFAKKDFTENKGKTKERKDNGYFHKVSLNLERTSVILIIHLIIGILLITV